MGGLEVITARELYYMGRLVEKIEAVSGRSKLLIRAMDGDYEYPVGILYTNLEKSYVVFQDVRDPAVATMLATVEIPSKAFLIVRFKNGIALEVRS